MATTREAHLRCVFSLQALKHLLTLFNQVVEASTFETLEALATLVAKTALEGFPVPQVTIYVEKPSALTFVQGAGVEIIRDRKWIRSLRADSNQANQLA